MGTAKTYQQKSLLISAENNVEIMFGKEEVWSEGTKPNQLKLVKKRMRTSTCFTRGLKVTLTSGEWNTNGKTLYLYFLRYQGALWCLQACVVLEDILSSASWGEWYGLYHIFPLWDRPWSSLAMWLMFLSLPFLFLLIFPFLSFPSLYSLSSLLANYGLCFVGIHDPKSNSAQWFTPLGINLMLLQGNQT